MKIGCSSAGCIKKVDAKSGPPRPITLVCASVVLLLVLSLIGCGRLSLLNLLENEEPGAFSVIPKSAVVPADTTVEVSGKGGFKPYSYEKITGKGKIDPNTGVYVAPTSGEITGDSEDTQIMVSDALDSEATLTLTVFKALKMDLNPESTTIEAGNSITFTVSGGVPDPDYDFYVNDVWKASASPSWSYTFTFEGSYTVIAEDSLGNRAVATITVFPAGDLSIDVAQNWVETDSTIDLTAVNLIGTPEFSIIGSTSTPAGSILNPTAPTATYEAPASKTVVTIQLKDSFDDDTTTVEIHVVSEEPTPLNFPSQVTIETDDDEGATLTVTGGISPYSFWLVGDGDLVDHPVHPHKIKYYPPDFVTTAYIWVEDAIGQQKTATIYVVEDD